jgi:hypothetical protein
MTNYRKQYQKIKKSTHTTDKFKISTTYWNTAKRFEHNLPKVATNIKLHQQWKQT